MFPLLFENQCRLAGQQFVRRVDMTNLLNSIVMTPIISESFYQPWKPLTRPDTDSTVTMDKDKFQVCVDVQQYSPGEITVKTVGRQITIEGKHEEKQDEHSHVSRHFVRKYQLPQEFRPEDVVSNLSTDGVLSITAPRQQPAVEDAERIVPITATDSTHNSIEHNTSENNSEQ